MSSAVKQGFKVVFEESNVNVYLKDTVVATGVRDSINLFRLNLTCRAGDQSVKETPTESFAALAKSRPQSLKT